MSQTVTYKAEIHALHTEPATMAERSEAPSSKLRCHDLQGEQTPTSAPVEYALARWHSAIEWSHLDQLLHLPIWLVIVDPKTKFETYLKDHPDDNAADLTQAVGEF